LEKTKNVIDEFQQFAEKRLKNHFGELKTRYQNEQLGSKELQVQCTRSINKYLVKNWMK
jgi:hypothetical protein